MLTPQFASRLTWFYPIGNTPALCLTQGIPAGKQADILLLGCGDVRNILFTAHTDGRPMDITCCDVENAILARNLVILSLIIDDKNGSNSEDHFSIYYHFYVNQRCLSLLQAQARKLHDLSISIATWRASEYSKFIRFCDYGTLAKVHELLKFYSLERTGNDLSSFESICKSSIQSSARWKSERSIVLTGLRSISPIGPHPRIVKDLDDLHKYYWQYGSTEVNNTKVLSQDKHFNPMFATPGATALLHYGTDPLLGFHLVTAYAPLAEELPQATRRSGLENIIMSAHAEFRAWSSSLRDMVDNITLRLFTGDAIALCNTLQCTRLTRQSTESAHWYRSRHCFEPLILDGDDYCPGGSAPLSFTTINTSNLVDHIGALNLLCAASPLLASDVSASLYTEILVRQDKTHDDLVNNLLCGHLTTVAILIGLTAVECSTNTCSTAPGHEMLLDLIAGFTEEKSQNGQQFVQMTWKRPNRQSHAQTLSAPLQPIRFDEAGLAEVFFQIYLQMFKSEDISQLLSNIDWLEIRKASLLYYHRGSFASMLRLIRDRVIVDWNKTMSILLRLVENNTTLLMGRNYIQELYVYLHLFGIFSVDILQQPLNTETNLPPTGDLHGWKNMPPIVCVTLVVPRTKLAVLTDENAVSGGTPPLQCVIQSASKVWQNVFAAIQVGFGELSTSGARNSNEFKVYINDDILGWNGNSPLFASFIVPSWILFLESRDASISFGIQSNPSTAAKFMSRLGPELNIYGTSLADVSHVYISRDFPNQVGFAVVPGFIGVDTVLATNENLGMKLVVTADADMSKGKISNVIGRLNIHSDDLTLALRTGCEVRTTCSSPWNFAVPIGKQKPLVIDLPVPVDGLSYRTRIARKSSYIEVVAPIATATAWKATPSFTYPIFAFDGCTPVLWSMPYLKLHALPAVDVSKNARLQWLTPHASLTFSAQERKLQSNLSLPRLEGERARLDLKSSLFSVIMHFTGLQGKREHVFGIHSPGNGGVHILLFVSKLQLDLSNRTIALDAAVLPLYDNLMPRIAIFLQSLTNRGVCLINVDDAELRLWKQMLPAWVERCRTWEHLTSCEYSVHRKIPLSVEHGSEVLCQCTHGKIPDDFMTGVPHWSTVAQYTARAAISLLFPCELVDKAYDGGILEGAILEGANKCRVCGSKGETTQSKLLLCSRCRKARYCSHICQRKDWKKHKTECSKS